MHLIKHRHLITSKILILLLVSLIWFTADNLLEFVFPTHLENINKSYFEIGFLLSLASISGMLIDLPMGALSNKASRKKLMISGLMLSIISSIFIFEFRGDLVLVFAFLFWGFAFQIWKVPRDAQFAAFTNKDKRAEMYGLDTEVKYIGQVLGPAIGGFVLLYLGFSGILTFYIVLLLLAILILFVCLKDVDHRSMSRAVSSSMKLSSLASELKEFHIFGIFGILLLCLSLLFTMWEQILWTFEPLFYGPNSLNIPPYLGGLLLAFFSLPGIFLSYFAGKMSDHRNRKFILSGGLLLTGFSLVAFSSTHNLVLIFIFALLTSCGWIFSLPALYSLIVDLSYKHKKGNLAGIWNLFMDAGCMIGPIMGGAIAEIWGIKSVFLVIGSLFVVSAIPLLLVKTRYILSDKSSKKQSGSHCS